MEQSVRARLKWIHLWEETGNLSLVSRRCGISRLTLRKWMLRYRGEGVQGLKDRSRRPLRSPGRRVTEREEAWILELRAERNLGARRIQAELLRLHEFRLSLETIHKVLKRHGVPRLKRPRRGKRNKRYARPIPGERMQLDTMKVVGGIIQYTAIDDCTRYRVLALFKRRTAANTLRFLEQVIEETPFPIQRIQTDRGREFFATKVQKMMMAHCIKFRPIRPASPHLNGKVERSHRTDIEEFYATVDLSSEDLHDQLLEWQHHYNWHRPHGGLGGITPMDRYFQVSDKTPCWDEIETGYDESRERIQEANYALDQKLRRW